MSIARRGVSLPLNSVSIATAGAIVDYQLEQSANTKIGSSLSIALRGYIYPIDSIAIATGGCLLTYADTPSGELPDADTIRLYRSLNVIKGPVICGELPIKYLDPDSKDLYFFDWSEDLEPEDTIQISDIVVDGTITHLETELIGQIVPVWLSGITLGDKVVITNRITTLSGRTLDKSFYAIGIHQ